MKDALKFLICAVALSLSVSAYAKKTDDAPLIPEYQVEGAGVTSDNAQQVLVTVLSKKKDVNDATLGICGVHAILFRDYDDATNAGFGSMVAHKSIMGSPTAERQHIDFFEPFFKNGEASNYVQVVANSRRVVKSGKQWKVSAVVKVNSAALRKDLKKQGLVKDLGSGW